MELFVHAEDCERLLWECRIWSGDKPLDRVTVGGNSKVGFLDGDDGLVALIMAKVEFLWPHHNKITLGRCTVKGDPESARYIAQCLIRLLEERTNECMADEYEPPDPQDIALQLWVDEQNKIKKEENAKARAEWLEQERIEDERLQKEAMDRIMDLRCLMKHQQLNKVMMKEIREGGGEGIPSMYRKRTNDKKTGEEKVEEEMKLLTDI